MCLLAVQGGVPLVWCMRRESNLPPTRKGRASLLRRDSTAYIRRMGAEEIDKLLLSLSKTGGLDDADVDELKEDMYNVGWEYIPDRLKE